ncbi:hypothetical protein GMOD_00010294 [Pyrenophora seminiperda CCB06]|uniref:Uncharacterized protein n=1 Tax=Pyrenophora seminiperda CCB06 TaxID=1302712 RepID=A0A3M7M5E6_9PLEO|nr:hypothetical protein GMOD_00010294 [Pyrenophora seminiperda CCB06]
MALGTTNSSDIPHEESSPEPRSSEKTNRTSSNESNDDDRFNGLLLALREKEAENAAFQQQLVEQKEEFEMMKEDIKQKRLHDKKKVGTAYEQYKAMKERHNALAQHCDRQLAKLTDEHQCAIEVLEHVHRDELASKDAEIEKVSTACKEKDKALARVHSERTRMLMVANSEKRKALQVSKAKADAIKAEMEALRTKYKQYEADCTDATIDQENLITDLFTRFKRKEREHEAVSKMLLQQFSTEPLLRQVMESNEAVNKEAKDLRSTVKRLKQQNENLLDTLQNTINDCIRHREAEQEARSTAGKAQDKIADLEDKVSLLKIQVRHAVGQLEKERGLPADRHCAALETLELTNEELQNSLQTERAEKAELQSKLDKLDDENLTLSINYDAIEAELAEQKKANELLHVSLEPMLLELQTLKKIARTREGAILEEDKENLIDLVHQVTREYQSLVQKCDKTTKDAEAIEKWGRSIKDKCDTEVRKAEEERNYYWSLYFDEAVATTERLHAEIANLKARLGEKHYVVSKPHANPEVNDRKFLPYMMQVDLRLQGVPKRLIPSAVYDPHFKACLSPTEDAMQTLRPKGWKPVSIQGKVWLSRVVKPFTEEDAEKRMEDDTDGASDQAESSRARMGTA